MKEVSWVEIKGKIMNILDETCLDEDIHIEDVIGFLPFQSPLENFLHMIKDMIESQLGEDGWTDKHIQNLTEYVNQIQEILQEIKDAVIIGD